MAAEDVVARVVLMHDTRVFERSSVSTKYGLTAGVSTPHLNFTMAMVSGTGGWKLEDPEA